MRPNSTPRGVLRADSRGGVDRVKANPRRRPQGRWHAAIRKRCVGAAARLALTVPLWTALLWAALPLAVAAPAPPRVVSPARPGAPSRAPVRKGTTRASPTSTQPPPSEAGGPLRGPARVRVGVLLLSVGDVSVASHSYTMDMYLIFTCDRRCNPGNFEIVNGRPLVVDAQSKTATRRVYRLMAQLRGAWDLHAYPFDSDGLTLAIEDKQLTADELVYVVDGARTAIDPTATVAGWDFPRQWSATVTGHAYPVFNETYSRYAFTTELQRPILVGVLTLAPAVILVAVGLLALGLRADLGTQRLTVSTSALVAMVLFHISLRAGLPPVGYFTFADRFVMTSYVVLAVIIVLAMVILNRLHAGDAAGAEYVRRISCWVVPAVWVGLETINVVMMLVWRGG